MRKIPWGWIIGAIVVIAVGIVANSYFNQPKVVGQGHIMFLRNPDYIAPAVSAVVQYHLYDSQSVEDNNAINARYEERYIEGAAYPNSGNRPLLDSAFAVIEQGKLGLIGTLILPPGNYYHIPANDVVVRDAVVIPEQYVGIKRDKSGDNFVLLPEGVHNALPEQVRIFPTGPQRYRLLKGELLDRMLNEPGFDPCQSVACDSTVNNVITSDPAVTAGLDLEIQFQLDFSSTTNLGKIWEMRDIATVVQTYIATPIRSDARGMFDDIAPMDLRSSSGRQTINSRISGLIEKAISDQPIEIISVGVRDVSLPQEYLDSQQEGAVEEQQLTAQQRVAELRMQSTQTASAFQRGEETLRVQHVADQITLLRQALNSDDPAVTCSLINIFYPGSCNLQNNPVSVTIDQNTGP